MASVEIKSGSSYVKQTVGLNKLPQQSYCLLTFGTFGGENYTLMANIDMIPASNVRYRLRFEIST